MKPKLFSFTRLALLALIFGVAGVNNAEAQNPKLQIDHLNYLSDKAVQIVDVTLSKELIKMGAMFLNDKKPDEAKIKEMLDSIEGVFVKRFEFESEGTFTDADVNPIRSQLQGPGWSRIVTYINRKKDGHKMNVEVFLMTEGSVIKGLAALATETKALTVVNLVGPIDLQKLAQIEGRFGIPNIGLKNSTGQLDETETKKPENKKP